MRKTGRFLKAAEDAITYGQGFWKYGLRKWYNPMRYIAGPLYQRWIPIKDIYLEEAAPITQEAWDGIQTAHFALYFRPFGPDSVAGILPFLPFSYKMPCGNVLSVTSLLQIPEHEVPCPCGNPNHWFIKHGEVAP